MARRPLKTLWLLCAFLLLTQSLLPVSAQAYVSVRCIGAPAGTPDCAKSLAPVDENASARSYQAPMSCCVHAMRGCAMTDGANAVPSLSPAAVSSLPCLVTVSPLTSVSPASAQSARLWMLDSSPANAPPTQTALRSLPVQISVRLPLSSFILPAPVFSPSHGLRAPPTI